MKAEKVDQMLEKVLRPKMEADSIVNQRIIMKAREIDRTEKEFRMRRRARYVMPIAAALCLMLGTITAVAASKYLRANEVAEEMQYPALAEALETVEPESDKETEVEEQYFGDYVIAFLGVASGQNLTGQLEIPEGKIDTDKTYCVVSIRNADGTSMPDTSEDAYGNLEFFASPLITGYNPVDYNAASMHGGYTDTVVDGTLYRIIECDNVEIFADHKLYLAVNDGMFYKNKAFVYDEANGEISRNETYEGVNALFVLPLDSTKADPEAALKYVQDMEEASSEEEDLYAGLPEEDREKMKTVHAYTEQITSENIDEYCEPVESTRDTVFPDEEGYVQFKGYEIEGRGGAGGGEFLASWLVPEDETMTISCFHSGDLESLVIQTYTRNDDGSYTFVAYIPKDATTGK